MRLKAGIWVSAYLRRCASEGLAVYVARRGDDDAGAILIKVDFLNGETMVYAPAIGMSAGDHGERQWSRLTGPDPVDDESAEQMIARQANFDPDIWVIVVEDRTGTALLDDSMIAEL
jgi:hypothetical protein